MNLKIIENSLREHEQTLQMVRNELVDIIADASVLLVNTFKKGNTVFICGNGGSAADAQHIAAEFTGRFVKEREGLPAVALTTDTSALTAIGNDYGFSKIYARQLEGLGKPGDLLIAISTSGNSDNIIEALKKAREKKMHTIGLSGKNGGAMNNHCDFNIVVPNGTTARIQEMHILIGHIFCECVDKSI